MSVAENSASRVRLMLEHAGRGENKKRRLEDAARRLGMEYWRAWGVRYGKVKHLWHEEYEAIRLRYETVRLERIAHLEAELAELKGREDADQTAVETATSGTVVAVAAVGAAPGGVDGPER